MGHSFLPALVAAMMLAACAPALDPLPPQTSPELLASLRNGTIDLTCETDTCAKAWMQRAESAANFTLQGRWAELTTLLAVTNYRTDLAWYFLGRTAEGLGSPKAAALYYAKARAELDDARSCNVSGLCRETDIAAAIDRGLAATRGRR